MRLRFKALRSLRWNYTRKGVWFWLKGRQRCRYCHGKGRVPLGVTAGMIGLTTSPASFTARSCPRCDGATNVRGYRRILSEPERVLAEQTQLAEGVFA